MLVDAAGRSRPEGMVKASRLDLNRIVRPAMDRQCEPRNPVAGARNYHAYD